MDDIPNRFAPLTDSELSPAQVIVAPDVPNAAPIMPIPKNAGRCSILFEGRQADERYWFKDLHGEVLFGELQWRTKGRDKRVRPCVFTTEGWREQAPPAPRALFNRDKLASRPNAAVFLFEGPRKASIAAPCFPDVVTSGFAGGASAAGQIDFSPLRGRHVTLWRDADDAGARWQTATISVLQSAGAASIRAINITRLPPEMVTGIPPQKQTKFDVVDFIEAGLSPTAIAKAAEAACEPVAIAIPESGPTPLASPTTAPEPYPTHALGDVLAAAARAIAAKVQCAEAMAAQSVLAVASLAAQGLADVRLPYGQTRPLSLFCLTIAASGDRKSSADLEAMAPTRMREKQLREIYEPLATDHAIAHAAWRGQRLQIERRKTDVEGRRIELQALGPEPDPPIKPILTLGESTAEGLAKHMPTLPGALGIFSAEGGQFLSGHGFSADAKLRTAASFASLWDGLGLRRLRAGDGLIDLQGRRLACHLMIQPEAAGGVLGDPVLRDQGLLSRFLIASPESLAGSRLWQEPHEGIEPALRRYIARALSLFEAPTLASNRAGNDLAPRALVLSSEARELWIAFHNAVEAAMGADGPLALIRDVAGKAAEQAGRIAGVLQMIDDTRAADIGAGAMERACQLADWYLREATRLASEALIPPVIRDAIALLDWLHGRGLETVTAATLQKTGPGPLRRKARLDPAVGALEEHRWLVPVDQSRRAWRIERRAA
jgi:hypothetical protein